jgi:2-polyprenyl-3-methyl-5-hydroxy-6-metoxy-1,4-benzoquinol methylase
MKYSDVQRDTCYQRLRELGKPVDYAGASFENFDLRPFLELMIPGLKFPIARPRVVEYGTGTGPGACFLAARGFQVDAIDLSPTAIELARKFAAERNLDIRYEVADICRLSDRSPVYDLVIDNFCLHCLVTDEQRSSALAAVHSMLKPTGYYLIGTAIFRADRDLGKDHCDPRTGTRYRKVGAESHDYEDAVLREDGWYCPRTRYVRADDLKSELVQAGFRVLYQDGGRVLCDKASVDFPRLHCVAPT